ASPAGPLRVPRRPAEPSPDAARPLPRETTALARQKKAKARRSPHGRQAFSRRSVPSLKCPGSLAPPPKGSARRAPDGPAATLDKSNTRAAGDGEKSEWIRDWLEREPRAAAREVQRLHESCGRC